VHARSGAAGRGVNAVLLWAGGAATAATAALVALLGVLVSWGILGIPLLAPAGEGAGGDADTATYMLVAAGAAVAATALMHLLLLCTPRPHVFFGWLVGLLTLTAAFVPLVVSAPRESQVATGVLNLLLGLTIGLLVSGSARAARRPPVPAGVGPAAAGPAGAGSAGARTAGARSAGAGAAEVGWAVIGAPPRTGPAGPPRPRTAAGRHVASGSVPSPPLPRRPT
jgi:hypothetical protein